MWDQDYSMMNGILKFERERKKDPKAEGRKRV